MRKPHLVVLAFIALTVPLSRGAAQTCQGMAAFQDGRWRAGVDDQATGDFNGVRGTVEFGLPQSIYGGIGLNGLNVSHPSRETTGGVGANLGYQIRIGGSPLQFCPVASWAWSTGVSDQAEQGALGVSIGYQLKVSNWFAVVPAAGAWLISTHAWSTSHVLDVMDAPTPGPSAVTSPRDNGTSGQAFVTVGLVFWKSLTINPGLIIPSQGGAKPVYTLGVSMNWAAPARR
jgi:hypothetical protein